MKHPPFPPNCIYFNRKNDFFLTPMFYPDGKVSKQLRVDFSPSDFNGRIELAAWRPIIAAVARAAWQDEQDRLSTEWTEAGGVQKYGKNKTWDEIGAMYDNSEAWRVWGERK